MFKISNWLSSVVTVVKLLQTKRQKSFYLSVWLSCANGTMLQPRSVSAVKAPRRFWSKCPFFAGHGTCECCYLLRAACSSLRACAAASHVHFRAGRMHWPTLLHSWLPFQEYDVYVVASQECEADIVASLHSPEKTEWEAKIRGTIGSKYCMIASETIGQCCRCCALLFALHCTTFAAIFSRPLTTH